MMTTDLPWFHRHVIVATTTDDHECVRHVQQVLEVPVTGEMDTATKTAIIQVQHIFSLPVTGSINIDTARQIERLRRWETL